MATGIAKNGFTLLKRNVTKNEFAQGKCEIETFQTGFVIQVLNGKFNEKGREPV